MFYKKFENMLFVLPLVLAIFVSVIESRQIILYQHMPKQGDNDGNDFSRGANLTITYGDECVELKDNFYKAASAVNTLGQCVVLYTNRDCTGSYSHVYPTAWGHSELSLLYNFNDLAASFERCDQNRKIEEQGPPYYPLKIFNKPNQVGAYAIASFRPGCSNMGKDGSSWKEAVTSVKMFDETGSYCVAFYSEYNCKGAMRYLLPGSPGRDNLADVDFDKKMSSWDSCDAYYKTSCQHCPKYIYKGSNEYEFWINLFSVYSPYKYRMEFEERVKKNPNGTISWDFLFLPNTAAERVGDQYLDALTLNLNLLNRLRYTREGYLEFTVSNVELLRLLARKALNDRNKHKTLFKENWQDHEFVVYRLTLLKWKEIVDALNELYKRWYHPESDCGKPTKRSDGTNVLISDGTIATYGDDPWHVAIYRIVKRGSLHLLICGGTIISETVVLSAAHCFYDKGLEKANNDTMDHEIYVGKYTRDYFKEDSKFQKVYKIAALVFNPKGYSPKSGHYGSDIILIILETPLTFNDKVKAACLDWESIVSGPNVAKGTMGKIVGWGENSNKSANDILLEAHLPYMSYSDCVGQVKLVTPDKFCAGALTGPGARRGDSGGGYTFENEGRHYLRGIVSTRDSEGTSSISTFTDVTLYLDWIHDYL